VSDQTIPPPEAPISAEQAESILRHVADSITVQAPDGRLLYANDAAVRSLGFASQEELLNAPLSRLMSHYELLDPDGNPLPVERLPGRLALAGIDSEHLVRYRIQETGEERWALVRGTPVFDDAGSVAFAINIFRDVTAARRAQERIELLTEAGEALAASLDYDRTLERVAQLAVPRLADWCVVDVREEEGQLRRIAVAHVDPAKTQLERELQERYPPDLAAGQGIARVLRTGAPDSGQIDRAMLEAAARDEEHLRFLQELGPTAYLCVPLVARGRTLGAITLVSAETRPRYTDADVTLAEELARRAALAVDNARLFHEAEARGHAARALAYVGDGVLLVDDDGLICFWNPAAEAITGLAATDVVGRPVAEAIRGWADVSESVPVASASGPERVRPSTVPLDLGERERWLSIGGVRFEDGTVFAFRDLTEERAIEQLKNDFVSTVSHELRTPLAAIYGAARTLMRSDIELEDEQRRTLLDVIGNESDRLARTINDILWASRLESGTLRVSVESCDASALVREVVEAARAHLPERITLAVWDTEPLPRIRCDPDKVRQVLSNLVENAAKYSPDGGVVEIRLRRRNGVVRFTVRDEGLGIADAEQRRIFEKFYRVDPSLSRGIAGTGLGLYICRELVRRMDGQIWVESREGEGSTFAVELPVASF
jgi:PAS domain S-box-containing protein